MNLTFDWGLTQEHIKKVKKNGKWTINSTKKIFANDFFEVFEDAVIKPDGSSGNYATIEFVDGVAVLPVDDENNIYLTKQFKYAIEREDLEVAAGVVENQDHLASAKREALEEVGIRAEKWTDLGIIEENTSITRSIIKMYLARELTITEPQPEENEQITVVKMPLNEALEKVLSGEITHDLSIILIMKVCLILKLY